MKIVAVCTAYHENDILPWTIEHLLAEGVDEVWIADPNPEDQVTPFASPVYWVKDDKTFHDQPYWIDRLAAIAEADWIIPFDADEFWCATSPVQTIRTALEALPPEVGTVFVGMMQQRDWWWREVPWKPASKVAYRWNPEAHIGPGNHGVEGVPGESVFNVLFLREIQFRSFEHYCRKVRERNATLDRELQKKIPELGFHMTRLDGASEDKLAQEWSKLMAEPVIWDPIPSKITPPVHLAPPVEPLPIDDLFDLMKSQPHDIVGHMDRLKEIAAGAAVLELGVNTGMSTVAFTAGKSPRLFSIDIDRPRWRPEVTDTHFLQDDSLNAVGAFPSHSFDVVFIDTSHTLRQTVEELKAYEPKVAPGGCLVLHDSEQPEVALAIQHFMHVLTARHREPTKVERYTHSNGLTILWLP